jgi:hypothetical protein
MKIYSKSIIKYSTITLAISLFSCSTVIKDFDKYQKSFTPKTAFMPSQDNIDGKLPKVVVFPLEENSNQVASQAGLGSSIANNVENILTEDKLAQIVDRSVATKLKNEIALSEINKTGSYKGPQIADYAISGAISNASFNSKYNQGTTALNPKTGTIISTPPTYKYNSAVAGNIKIYELPSLEVIGNIEIEGKDQRTENVRENGGISLGAISIGSHAVDGVSRDDGLVREAGKDAIINSRADIKNIFAKKGYILEKRIFDDKAIFKISLGSLDGVKQDDKFDVVGQFETQNPLNNKTEIEKRNLATGIISNLVDPKTSWVVIDDKKAINSIRIGDSVKIKYKNSKFDKIARTAIRMAK